MARARGPRTPVFVTIRAGTAQVKYGFGASARSAPHRAALGQTIVTAANSTGVFFGANSPKPQTASKEFPAGIIGSFCDDANVETLKADDWNVSPNGRLPSLRRTGRTRTVGVEMPGGWTYCWHITVDDVDLGASLGFDEITNLNGVVLGVNSPKPPRATRRVNGSTESSFIEPRLATMTAAAAAGFRVSGVSYDLLT